MDLRISAETVSRLVLGHLRSEKSRSTYREYINSCPHLRNASSPTNRSKFITTRLRGLSLFEVLQEYAAVDNLVQEYLEALGYFRNHKKTCLLDEVVYLLSLTGAQFDGNRSRSSTPLRAHSVSPLLQPNYPLSPIIETSIVESEVNTTALQDLPGNTADNSRTFKELPKNANASTSNETTPNQSDKDVVDDVVNDNIIHQDNDNESPVKSTNSTSIDCSLERIQQTILEHPEFQAKIAENINSIINTSVHSTNKQNTAKVVPELDSTIKMILQKTEEDPMFERLLEDLIGDATSVSSQHNHNVESSENMLHTPKKLCPQTPGIKLRLRSSRKSVTGNDPVIDSSNNDVIDKIVSAAAVAHVSSSNGINSANNIVVQTASSTTCQTQNQSVASTTSSLSNADIILYDGPLDTLFPPNIQHSASPGGLLMVQPQLHTCQTPTVVQTSAFSSSSLVTPVQDVNKPQQSIYMLADNGDVISLPSQMIVCTSDANMMQQQQYVTAQQAQTIVLPSASKYTPVNDKPQANSLVDLFSTYKATDTSAPRPRRLPVRPRDKPQPQRRIKTILPMPTYKIDILPIPEEQPSSSVPQQTIETVVTSNSNASTDCEETPMTLTPEVPVKKTVTPKSGSHVRVLDFNFVTPAKETIETSVPTKKENGKSGKSVKSLFTTPNVKKKVDLKSWDANLRQLAVPSAILPEVVKVNVGSTQQPAEVPRVEDANKIAEVSVDLNNTLQDADLIEKALLMDSEEVKKSPRKLTKHSANVVKKSLRIRKKSESTTSAADTLLTLSKPLLKDDLNLPDTTEDVIATPPSSTKSRIKRKCNIDSSIKQAVTVTRVKEIKSLDILTESGAKLILSPSKLANKRSIVNVDSNAAVDLTKTLMNMPALETPIKLNSYNNPQTPNISSSNETPFTKMFNEQMEGVDISAIPTPKLPITPSLNLFNLDQIGCFNRPTDYSTSSSYYQPSDSDQNKSLEKQIIEECRRLEGNINVPAEVEPEAAIATVMMKKNSVGIARKNLNLINPEVLSDSSSSSSSSSSTSSDSDSDDDNCQKTAIQNEQESTIYKLRSRTVSPVIENVSDGNNINAILSSTNYKAELVVKADDKALTQQEQVLKDLEAKRKRTIAKFKGKEKEVATKGVTTRSSRGRLIKPVKHNEVKPKPTRKVAKRASVKRKSASSVKLQEVQVLLHPLDIVETHLSEHSAASTPVAVAEEQLPPPVVKKQTQEESQTLLNMILTSAKGLKNEMVYKPFAVKKQSRLEEKIKKIKKERDYAGEKKRSGESEIRKIPESKVSPDLEAEKLVKGLKQWGIHLVPKAKSNEKAKKTEDKKEEIDKPKDMDLTNKSEVITFDDKLYTDEDVIETSFDSKLATRRSIKDYDCEVLKRKFTSRIFIDELNDDVDICLTVSPFETLFDLPSAIEILSPPLENNKIQILDQVKIIPISESFQNSFMKDSVKKNSTDFLTSNSVDEMPKSITDFQMIKDMQAKLDKPGGLTPSGEDDSLYDFALTNAKRVDSPVKLSKKRVLNDSLDNQSPKRPKIDHEQLLQEFRTSDKKKSSKTANNTAKSKSDTKLLNYGKIDVEHLLSVLHP